MLISKRMVCIFYLTWVATQVFCLRLMVQVRINLESLQRYHLLFWFWLYWCRLTLVLAVIHYCTQSHYIEVVQGGVSSRAIQDWLQIFSLFVAKKNLKKLLSKVAYYRFFFSKANRPKISPNLIPPSQLLYNNFDCTNAQSTCKIAGKLDNLYSKISKYMVFYMLFCSLDH